MLAWVDLNDSRLAAQLDWDPARKDEIKPGMKARMVCGVLRQEADGKEIVGYKFRPLFDGEAQA
jgi:hypothetical protein